MACIFCKSTPLTKEHIWADWLKDFIPRGMAEYGVLQAIAHADRSEFKATIRKGDIHEWQVRCVCGKCNNGWMSRLQVEAKDTLVRLLRGEQFILDANAQGSVAAWIAMAVMAADAGDRQRPSVQQVDRSFLRSTNGPPLNWRITIGDFERENWPVYWARHPMCIVESIEPGADRAATFYNAQFTTFVTGRLIASVSVAPPGTKCMMVSMPDGLDSKLRQIWPPVRSEFSWPPGKINDDEADKIARAGIERALRVGREMLRRQELEV